MTKRERLRLYAKRYRDSDKGKAWRKKYLQKNRAKIRKQNSESYRRNAEKRKAKWREWYRSGGGREYYQKMDKTPKRRAYRTLQSRLSARRRRADAMKALHIKLVNKKWRDGAGALSVIRHNLKLPSETPAIFLKAYRAYQLLKKEIRR